MMRSVRNSRQSTASKIEPPSRKRVSTVTDIRVNLKTVSLLFQSFSAMLRVPKRVPAHRRPLRAAFTYAQTDTAGPSRRVHLMFIQRMGRAGFGYPKSSVVSRPVVL